jgi:protocatechuate 3,4-dioxygenase alpha subunit
MADRTNLTALVITPSQTVGPFFASALTPTAYDYAPLVTNDLRTADAVGHPIRVQGILYDGAGLPVPDAMVEIWQADGQGHYPGNDTAPLPPNAFKGFGRCECDQLGQFTFTTVKPGSASSDPQAPHLDVGIFARGLLRRLFTRIYFDDEATNQGDPILALVPEEFRSTLIARRTERTEDAAAESGLPLYVLDIHLQGERETVFFDA